MEYSLEPAAHSAKVRPLRSAKLLRALACLTSLMLVVSMISGRDLADLISLAEATGSKVILAGDTAQLEAVENGGGMTLLADQLGYMQLAEPVRFRAGWSRPPACGCAPAMLRWWPTTTSTAGPAAATRNR